MAEETFDYERAIRYRERTIKKNCTSLTAALAKPSTTENVAEVRLYSAEVTKDYEAYKHCCEQGFNLIDLTLKADEIKKKEDAIIANQEVIQKLVNPILSKANVYISEFEGERIRESLTNTSINASMIGVTEPNVKLPRINIPKFDGNIEDFLEFSALFQNVVHDEASLSKIRKLYYLKESLIGTASDLIKDIPLTERGYDEAWGLVQSTYKDIKAITRRHLDKLFAINRIKSPTEIPNLLSNVNRVLKGLKACGEEPDNWSTIICYMISEKLDETTYIDFEKSLTTNTKFPGWSKLRTFLENRSSVTKRSSDAGKPKPETSHKKSTVLTATSPDNSKPEPKPNQSRSKPKCVCCAKFHLLIECEDFKVKTPKQRFDVLKSKSTCLNCFKNNHKTSECNRPNSCKQCSGRHHTLLHFENAESTNDTTKSSSTAGNSGSSSTPNSTSATCLSIKRPIVRDHENSSLAVRNQIVLLPTAIVNFESNNKRGKMRVLLDSGSQTNLITRDFVKKFKIQTVKSNNHTILGVTNTSAACNRVAKIVVKSRVNRFVFETDFLVINSEIPYSVCNMFTGTLSNEIQNLPLADPEFLNENVNLEIDAVLGIEAYDLCVQGEVRRIGALSLRQTQLGWTLSSKIDNQVNQIAPYCGLTVANIDNRLKKFWEIEEVNPVSNSNLTEAEECDKHFEKTYRRNDNGQFVVCLPFKNDPSKIVGNFDRALWHLNATQKRLIEPASSMYIAFMDEYKDLGHMTQVNNDVPRYFIPHHAVLKLSSTTTKLRVVFNASSKSPNQNLSLNDVLMIGPALQPDIFDILIRFRTYRYAFTADVEKMYRKILVDEQDRRYQSILWNGKIHELNTVTYGTAPASYQAQKCLQKLADENEKINPIVSRFIRENFYMDDFAGGADTEAEAIRLQKSVHDILSSADFRLRKYQSNSSNLLNEINAELIEKNLTVTFGSNESLSVLGLSWTPSIDNFNLKTELGCPSRVTKRIILSIISKTFDPLGFASPVIIRGKLLFQSLWKLDLKWDDAVPEEIVTEFKLYVNDLNEIHKFSVPRYIVDYNRDTAHLIGFADASERAYCAAVYVANTETSTVHLLCAKTRVAPVKILKVPQLELQAAVLLVELVDRVRKLLEIAPNHIHLFTDSTIVLSWLARPPGDWKTFVRNRVSKIINIIPNGQWSHVRTNENPADLATRGLTVTALTHSNLWLNGPEFIQQGTDSNTAATFNPECLQYLSKPKTIVCTAIEIKSEASIIESFSSYSKLLRVFATVPAICRKWKTKSTDPVRLEKSDIDFASKWLIQTVQSKYYADELHRLRANRKICKRSPLRYHLPFLDQDGIIRSRSRLQNANLSFQRKCPIILPAKAHLTSLYVQYIHTRFFHANRSFLLTHLSSEYLLVGGISNVIKRVIRNCVTCRRHFYKPNPQQLANLPVDRVTPQPPFSIVGIDFTGAFSTKCNHHRTTKYGKSYAAIFVCFATRAVHIEIVPSLSTEDFLNSLKCFVSRRGLPTTIYSDNGTNFKGAERYLNFQDAKINEYALNNQIDWKFNPPYTPHRGGIWESAVKSAKRFIPIVTKGQLFTENELRTLLTQIECILNSRPLAYLNTNEPAAEVLTPSHFLIGRNLSTVPEPSQSPNISLSNRYLANQTRIRDFWRLWSKEYLNQLRCRSKWLDVQPNLTTGQVVIVKDNSSAPCEWKLGKVIKCFPDVDDLVRTVSVLVNGEERTLPSHKVIPLPTSTIDTISR